MPKCVLCKNLLGIPAGYLTQPNLVDTMNGPLCKECFKNEQDRYVMIKECCCGRGMVIEADMCPDCHADIIKSEVLQG